jgi:hypothetical protein
LAVNKLLKRIFIFLLASVFITVLSTIGAEMLNGAFHSNFATTVFFPFTTLVLQHTRWETLASLLMAIQFQVYALLLAVSNRQQRGPLMLVLGTVHAAAAVIGFMFK